MLLAPGRFSTTTGRFQALPRPSATARPSTSVAPPAGYGTTRRTALFGKAASAQAVPEVSSPTPAAARNPAPKRLNALRSCALRRFACICCLLWFFRSGRGAWPRLARYWPRWRAGSVVLAGECAMLRCVDNDQTGQNDWPNRSGERQALANPDCAVQPALDKVAQRPGMSAPARQPDEETHAHRCPAIAAPASTGQAAHRRRPGAGSGARQRRAPARRGAIQGRHGSHGCHGPGTPHGRDPARAPHPAGCAPPWPRRRRAAAPRWRFAGAAGLAQRARDTGAVRGADPHAAPRHAR
ncbi:hypothetical protein D3C81_1415160 [compost metagenome]